MQAPLPCLQALLAGGELGEPTYARISWRHANADPGADLPGLLSFAQALLGDIQRVHARGQWIAEAGALTLTLDHVAGAVSLVDLSAASVRPSFDRAEILLRLEGDKGTAELLPGAVLRISGAGWHREELVEALQLPETQDPNIDQLVARAMRSAEVGEAV